MIIFAAYSVYRTFLLKILVTRGFFFQNSSPLLAVWLQHLRSLQMIIVQGFLHSSLGANIPQYKNLVFIAEWSRINGLDTIHWPVPSMNSLHFEKLQQNFSTGEVSIPLVLALRYKVLSPERRYLSQGVKRFHLKALHWLHHLKLTQLLKRFRCWSPLPEGVWNSHNSLEDSGVEVPCQREFEIHTTP